MESKLETENQSTKSILWLEDGVAWEEPIDEKTISNPSVRGRANAFKKRNEHTRNAEQIKEDDKKIIDWFKRGVTLQEMADRLGLSPRTISRSISRLKENGKIIDNRETDKNVIKATIQSYIERSMYSEAIQLLNDYSNNRNLSERDKQIISYIKERLELKVDMQRRKNRNDDREDR